MKGELIYNQGTDIKGPLTIGLSLERQRQHETKHIDKQQRIVVIGDGDFLSNTYLGNSGNLDLGVRLINWLSHDDDFIAIPVRTAEDLQLNMSSLTVGVIGIGFLIILPLSLLGTGAFVWWRRKNL